MASKVDANDSRWNAAWPLDCSRSATPCKVFLALWDKDSSSIASDMILPTEVPIMSMNEATKDIVLASCSNLTSVEVET